MMVAACRTAQGRAGCTCRAAAANTVPQRPSLNGTRPTRSPPAIGMLCVAEPVEGSQGCRVGHCLAPRPSSPPRNIPWSAVREHQPRARCLNSGGVQSRVRATISPGCGGRRRRACGVPGRGEFHEDCIQEEEPGQTVLLWCSEAQHGGCRGEGSRRTGLVWAAVVRGHDRHRAPSHSHDPLRPRRLTRPLESCLLFLLLAQTEVPSHNVVLFPSRHHLCVLLLTGTGDRQATRACTQQARSPVYTRLSLPGPGLALVQGASAARLRHTTAPPKHRGVGAGGPHGGRASGPPCCSQPRDARRALLVHEERPQQRPAAAQQCCAASRALPRRMSRRGRARLPTGPACRIPWRLLRRLLHRAGCMT